MIAMRTLNSVILSPIVKSPYLTYSIFFTVFFLFYYTFTFLFVCFRTDWIVGI